MLLSGFSLVGTVQDAIGGYHVTAAGRAGEIALLSAGLLTGVVLGLKVAARAGVTMDVAAELPPSGARVAVVLGAAALASAFYALGGYATPLALLVAALAGGAGRGTFVLLTSLGSGRWRRPAWRRRSSARPRDCCAGSGGCRGGRCRRWWSRWPGSARCCPG